MIIIGDVHGCYKTLMALLEKLPKDQKICFVGDLIDRGKDSRKVLDYVFNNFIDCVRGNHEDMFLYDDGMARMTKLQYGNIDEVNRCKDAIRGFMPYFREYDIENKAGRKLFVCHGGLCSEDIAECVKTGTINWLSSGYYNHPKYFQVVGHMPVKEPVINDFMAMIDTGCVFNTDEYNKLTALQFPEMIIYQQENIE